MEFFLGTDPSLGDVPPWDLRLVEGDPRTVEITLPRSKLAADLTPTVWSGADLERLDPRDDVTVESEPLDRERDLLRLTLPALEESQFYRVVLP